METLIDATTVAHEVVWSMVTTVDRSGRPRARVLHPVWEAVDGGIHGWILSRPTPLKTRHLAANPHVSCSYLSASHDVAYFDCVAEWVDAPDERRRVWDFVAAAPAPVGYDPATIFPDGPDSAGMRLLRLLPYRIQVGLAVDLARGEKPRLWRAA